MTLRERTIKTSHAAIAIVETSGKGLPVLLIHGNSSCKEVFRPQIESELGERFRLIAMDLPGHGRSADAVDPEKTYTMPGYADAAVETLATLGVDKVAVLGWSLGGHIGMEMLPRFGGIAGLMIAAAPPVGQSPEAVQAGFRPNPNIGLVGKPDFTAEEAELFALANYGAMANAELRQAIARTDGRARQIMFANLFSGGIADQKSLVENATVPVAVVNGAEDPFVNTEYVASVKYRHLWDKHCFVLRGLGHAAFLTGPAVFNPIFLRFLSEVEQSSGKPEVRDAKSGSVAA